MPTSHTSAQPFEEDPPPEDVPTGGAVQKSNDALDDLLDQIDGTLQTNAEQFVRSFVQKGGQ